MQPIPTENPTFNYTFPAPTASSLFYSVSKRVLDIGFSATALVVVSPLFALVAILIKLTDRGPIFYHQIRVGKNGRQFWFVKFRSMIPNADKYQKSLEGDNHHKHDTRTFKIKDDPRVTWIGKIIRRFSVDELPQFWNILKGDMTLVGPRPAVPKEVDQYNDHERRRLDVTPGLTCIWQVSGRADLDFSQQVEMDLEYIRSRNLWVDFKLMALTIPAVITGKGAY